MQGDGLKNDQGAKDREDPVRRLARRTLMVFTGALALSLFSHVISLVKMPDYRTAPRRHHFTNREKIKIRVVDAKTRREEAEKKKKIETADATKILETPQTKTERPDKADFVGTTDHKTQKETRIAKPLNHERGKNAGDKGNPEATAATESPKTETPRQTPQQPQPNPKSSEIKVTAKAGAVSFGSYKPEREPRNQYEALLPSSVNDLPGQLDAGYKEFIDEKIADGDRIDINTTEYRFIGYFTNMRKAIELVWNYPSEASRRGMEGEVGLEFTIGKDGKATRIRVIKSSGYPILDKAIVDAIKLASPFSPLPTGFGREKINIVGSFRYVLTSFGSH